MEKWRIIFFLMGLIIMLELATGIVLVNAQDNDLEEEVETEATKDAYIRYGTPTTNYGDDFILVVGNDSKPAETYLYFDFEDEPSGWTDVEIALEIYYVSEKMEIELYYSDIELSEYYITWQSRPNMSDFNKDSFIVSDPGENKFDVKDAVEDFLDFGDLGMVVCINHSDNYGCLNAWSREYTYGADRPRLIWTYVREQEFPYLILIGIIIGVGAGAVLVVMAFIVISRRNNKKKQIKQETLKLTVEPLVGEKGELEVPPGEPTILCCSFCGATLPKDAKSCPYCFKDIGV